MMAGTGRKASQATAGAMAKKSDADEHYGGADLEQVVGAAIEEPLQLVDVVVEHRH